MNFAIDVILMKKHMYMTAHLSEGSAAFSELLHGALHFFQGLGLSEQDLNQLTVLVHDRSDCYICRTAVR